MPLNHKHFLLVFKNCYYFMFFHNNSGVKRELVTFISKVKGMIFKKFAWGLPFQIIPFVLFCIVCIDLDCEYILGQIRATQYTPC